MINNIKKDIEIRMKKCIEMFKGQINKLHASRISLNLLNSIFIEYHGKLVPLYQLANLTVENEHTLKIDPFDKTTKLIIEKAIIDSKLDLNINSVGTNIQVSLPPLTEERRKNLIRMVRNETEQTKIAIRNIRRNANDKIKILLKNREISKDEEHHSQEEIQKITNMTIKAIDKILTDKEIELMRF